jgi:long-subunit fatty acid transport protein
VSLAQVTRDSGLETHAAPLLWCIVRRMRRALRASAVSALVLSALLSSRAAHATGVIEFPDNGSEQQGRGGAWVARASDPLAAFYNPAGLAGQQTRLTLQANISTQNTCFTRVKATNDPTADGVMAGGTYPKVCQNGSFFPNPQLAFTYRLTDRIGLGIAVLGPSAVGGVTWPDFQGTSPAAQRYLLVSSSVLLLTPSIGVGWEPIDGLRVGASFIIGTAPNIDFISVSPALVDGTPSPSQNDIRAELKAKDLFIPGFTLGAIYSPVDRIDVAAWYKYTGSINATGDVTTQTYFYENPRTDPVQYGDTSQSACFTPQPGTNPPSKCGSGNNAKLTVPIPMEAKLGVRYHQPRSGVEHNPHRRDPIAQDVFDIEADFTWANDSAFNAIQLAFPGTPGGLGVIPANPGLPASAVLPPNANVTHAFKDVFGVRLGGDYNILPDQLAVRAGGFFESQAAVPQYQNIDFDGASRFGVALGGTYRLRLGDHPLDLMAGYGHVFFATLSNTSPGAAGLTALTGEVCAGGAGNRVSNSGNCTQGTQPQYQQYRTPWAVNLGTITSSIDVINVGASFGF